MIRHGLATTRTSRRRVTGIFGNAARSARVKREARMTTGVADRSCLLLGEQKQGQIVQ
jgi:hypothetical protein